MMRIPAIIALALIALPVFAQEGPLEKVYACAGITDSQQRLACYDSAVAGLKHAESAGGLAVVNREQIEKAEKEAFGLPTPSLSVLAESARSTSAPAADKPKALERVTFPVKSVSKGPDGKYRFVMENGQEWRQTDSIILPAIGKGPWQAEIRKAAIGSYMLKLDDRTAVRVKRME
ncbi:MAG TPA: hypothetical protein VFV70_15425 [Hyphomonadaceae bacterium]|nr:hypothetical protein [Hyphomonadaceae bacterium]